MKLKIGDKVRFLNEVGGGRITSIINENLVNVETEDGFDVPTQTNNLIVVNIADDYDKKGGAQKTIAPSRPAAVSEKRETKPEDPWFSDKNQRQGKEEIQFLFALVPQIPANPPTGDISMYLINNCNDTLLYRFAKKTKYNYETVATGALSPNAKLFLGLIKPEMIAELPAFCFQLLHFKKRTGQFSSDFLYFHLMS